MNFDQFVMWERATRDTIDVKKTYIDMAEDLVAGVLLSQIVFWYLPKEDGSSRLKVEKDGHLWIAKGREDWWDETRISPKQFDRCVKVLEDKGLIVKETFKFDGSPTIHIRIQHDRFMELWNQIVQSPIENPYKKKRKDKPEGKMEITQRVKTSDDAVFPQREKSNFPSDKLPDGEIGSSPKGKNEIPETGKSLTKITTEITNKEKDDDEINKKGGQAPIPLARLNQNIVKAFTEVAITRGFPRECISYLFEKLMAADYVHEFNVLSTALNKTLDKHQTDTCTDIVAYFLKVLESDYASYRQIFGD